MKEYGAFWNLPTLQAHLLADPFTNPGPASLRPAAVIGLIAGISLFDAMLIAVHAPPKMALIAVAGFALTLALQKFISGT